jgi:hypothetical protein
MTDECPLAGQPQSISRDQDDEELSFKEGVNRSQEADSFIRTVFCMCHVKTYGTVCAIYLVRKAELKYIKEIGF